MVIDGIDIERLHKQPKTERGSGKTFDCLIQILGTVEVLLANNEQANHVVPVFLYNNVSINHMQMRLFYNILRSRGITGECQQNEIIINNVIRIIFFTNYFGTDSMYRIMRRLRGYRLTNPVFDPDCGLYEWEKRQLWRQIQYQIK